MAGRAKKWNNPQSDWTPALDHEHISPAPLFPSPYLDNDLLAHSYQEAMLELTTVLAEKFHNCCRANDPGNFVMAGERMREWVWVYIREGLRGAGSYRLGRDLFELEFQDVGKLEIADLKHKLKDSHHAYDFPIMTITEAHRLTQLVVHGKICVQWVEDEWA
jgi:hypothetical protein